MKIKKSENNKNAQLYQIFKLISSIIILISIFLQLECFLFFFLKLFTNSIILSIFLFISFNYLLLHYTIESFLFLIQFPFFGKASFNSNGCSLAHDLIKHLTLFIDICEKIVDNEKIILSEEYINILDIYERINLMIYLFYEMKKRYGLSKYQEKFYNSCVIWRKHFNQFKVIKYFEENKKYIENNDTNCNILFNKNLVILILDSNFIIKIADDFLCDEYHILSFKKIFNYSFNDTFCSENQFKTEFCLKFKENFNKFITKDNKVIDYIIIDSNKINNKKNNKDNNINQTEDESIITTSISSINDDNYNYKKEKNEKNIIIYCNPNSMIYQFFSPDKYNFFYQGNCDILFYNYRGYGSSDAFSNFDNIKSDILELYDEIKSWNRYNKIGVYGYSIGGIPATHLAKNRNIDLLISDRNFANLGNIAEIYPFGCILKLLCKILYIDRISNDMNYLFTKNIECIKIILCDSMDEVVVNNGSIKSAISRYILKNKNKKENILELFFDDYEKNVFINSLISIGNFFELNKTFMDNLFIIYLKQFYECFSFGSEDLYKYYKMKTKRLKIFYIKNFFNNFFIWGTKNNLENKEKNYLYDINNNIYYINKAIDTLNILQNMKNNLSELNEDENILNDIKMVKDGIIRMKNNMDNIKINDNINKGYLIRLKYGHNVILKGTEEKILVKILQKENFLK